MEGKGLWRPDARGRERGMCGSTRNLVTVVIYVQRSTLEYHVASRVETRKLNVVDGDFVPITGTRIDHRQSPGQCA